MKQTGRIAGSRSIQARSNLDPEACRPDLELWSDAGLHVVTVGKSDQPRQGTFAGGEVRLREGFVAPQPCAEDAVSACYADGGD